jgi:asparagine synthase (glutamine-hydrolysing)
LYTADFIEQSRFLQQPQPTEQWLIDNPHLNIVDACLLTDTNTYLPDDLLVKVDITSMANSLEARSPLLDTPLMEWAARLPAHYKLRGSTSKYILRKALEDGGLVPRANMARPKMGFGVPIGDWFQNAMKTMLCDTLLSERSLSRGYFRPDEVRRLVNDHVNGHKRPRLSIVVAVDAGTVASGIYRWLCARTAAVAAPRFAFVFGLKLLAGL